jgi:pyridoxal phosphate enzyme (YggS family)
MSESSSQTVKAAPEPASGSDVAANLAAVRDRVAAAARAAARAPEAITLVAVSKTHEVGRIIPALDVGQRVFGENRVQEADAKWPDLRRRYPDVELHLIGHLQTNKVRQAVALFDVIETLDRPKLARALAAEMARTGHRVPCYVEVNVGEEDQKSGIRPREADGFIAFCRDELLLPVVGVMCIPPADEEPAPFFALLAKIARRNGLAVVSMGMSADFEAAIAFGATHVRVGTAIFGSRHA